MERNKVIVFDFDGVIVNSCQMSYEINREYFSDIQFSELQDWAEGNVFSKKLRDNFDEKSEAYYFEQYSRRVVELIPVEGMEDIFKKLKLQDYKLVIVSSADEESIKKYLTEHKLDKYFSEIMAKNTHTSKVEKFKMVFKKYKIKPQETLIVTDSVGDVKEAHEAKMKAIGVIWGLHEKERLEKNGTYFIAEKPNNILTGIKKILALK